ncbi:MAG: hypothetical protein JWO30_613 [Fibrobacteres bacterium]|nr:hypothetical protein [Fibrobacterota bacterium]
MRFERAAVFLFLWAGSGHAQATWVHPGSDGKLVYKTDADGNRVMDFSSAGYGGGGVAIPTVPIKVTVHPSGGDDRAAIQNAIDQVAKAPMVAGFRGAVFLAAGTFHTSGPVDIAASGVVVRGAGAGKNGTIIASTGGSLFHMAGSGSRTLGPAANLADAYVPSGSQSANVENASAFSVGDQILITKTVTAAWVAHVGMDKLYRDDANGVSVHQTWLAPGTKITTDRTIAAIDGKKLTFDAPITDNFDSKYLGSPVGTVSKYAYAGRISQCGIEDLKIVAPADANSFVSVQMDAALDCWARNLVIQDGVGCFHVERYAKRITVDSVVITHTVVSTDVARPADFLCIGTQVLFNKCQSNGTGSWSWTTGSTGTGPMVVLNYRTTQNSGISPHARWTTGILTDGGVMSDAPKGAAGISYRNRGIMGSGHGWTTGWSVAWNVTTPYFLVSNAPGSINWAIGGVGTKTSIDGDPDGIFDHFNSMVTPASLYLAQLQERLGAQAVKNIGYAAALTDISAPRARLDPGPFQASLLGSTLSYTLSHAGSVVIGLYRTNGAALASSRVAANAGENRADLERLAGAHAPGLYFVNVSLEGGSRRFSLLLN